MNMPKPETCIRQNAITEGDMGCILTCNCEGTEQLQKLNEVVV